MLTLKGEKYGVPRDGCSQLYREFQGCSKRKPEGSWQLSRVEKMKLGVQACHSVWSLSVRVMEKTGLQRKIQRSTQGFAQVFR